MVNREGQEIANYRLIRLLGQGGFASIYLAEHLYLMHHVAIKLLDRQKTIEQQKIPTKPDLLNKEQERFLLEARNTVYLRHPNILKTIDFGMEAGIQYLVMEYAPNGSLREHHPRGKPLPLTTVVLYVKQIASALQYMHDKNIIHRDIKPENMLLGPNNEVLLSDFGIAVNVQNLSPHVTHDIAGTPSYMAPEQIQGKPTPASDQYSLGIVTYEWLTGTLPFEGTFGQVASQHLYASPPPLREWIPNISPLVEFVVQTAIARDQSDRFASVQGFANALERVSNQAYQFKEQLEKKQIQVWPPTGFPLSKGISVLKEPTPTGRSFSLENGDGFSPNNIHKPLIEETRLSLFAIARIDLEDEDKAIVGNTYSVQAGVSQSLPKGFEGGLFEFTLHSVVDPILFDISLHTSENIQLTTEWYQYLQFLPNIFDPQLVSFSFQLIAPGISSIVIDFYHERRWLKTTKFEFDAFEKLNLPAISSGG